MADRSGVPRQLPADIEAEILLRLPVKTLIRFKCCCKSWYSLISSPQFQKHHFRCAQHRPPRLLTLQINETDPDDYLTLSFSVYNNLTPANNFSITLPDRCYQPLMKSCLGLVCIFFQRGGPVLLCNPSTQDLISLPPTQEYAGCVGFGYAPSTEDFKVVSFFYMNRETSGCQVLTLSTRRWRDGKTPPYAVFDGTAPFLHGAIHFLPSIFSGVKGTDCIGVFDIDTEEYREGIRLPTYYYNLGDCEGRGIVSTRDFIRLTLLGGSLCLTFDFGEHKWLLELWLLKDYSNADWVKGYTIDVSVYPYTCYSFEAYPVDTEGDDVFLNCRDDVGVSLLGYNPQDGTVTVKKNKESAAVFYIENFYPLGSK